MPQASLQANAILGDGILLGALKKGGAKGVDAILAGDAKTSADMFSKLLAGIHKAKNGDLVSAVLTDAPVQMKGVDINLGPIMELLPPEVAAVLKKLNITALKNVPPEVAGLFNKLATEAPLSENGEAFLTAIAALGDNEAIPAELFQLIDDAKLAAFLAGLNTLVTENRNESISVDANGMITVLFEDGTADKPVNTTLPAGVATPALIEAARKELEYLQENTITIADLDGDAFQNLKKLMFADIAPYLTMPRTVRVGDGTVMKVAQGPSFLTEDNTDSTMLAVMAGLVPALTPQTIAPVLEGASSDLGIAQQETVILPPFLNAETLANAQTPQPQGAQKPAAFTHANFMAALLGVAQPQAQGQKPADVPAGTDSGTAAQPAADLTAPAAVKSPNALLQAAATPNTHLAGKTETASTALTRGFEDAMKGLDTFMTSADGAIEGFENGFRVHADQSLPGNSGSALLAAKGASQMHPSTHLISVSLQRAIQNAMPFTPGTDRQITIQMEPGNLGRLKITLQFGENNSVKAKMLAENPETVALLQKDAGVLERTLQNAGLDVTRADMSFDLAGGDAFSGSLRDEGGGSNHQSKTKNDDGTEFALIETVMPIFVDPETGLTHVNVVV